MHLLIADDDSVYRELLEQMLSGWGHEVTVVNDGQEAWDALQRNSGFELAVIDWMMPNLDGFELCRKIRQDPVKAELYIILMTGSRRKDEIIKVLVAGADDYLIKPFDPIDLQIHLRTAQRILTLQKQLAARHVGAT